MLKPKQMSRVLVVGHKDILEKTVNALYKTNLFHIEDFIEDESGLKIGKPFGDVDTLSTKLIKIRSIATFLGIKDEACNAQKVDSLMQKLNPTLEMLEKEVSSKTEKKVEFESKIKELESLKKDILPFTGILLTWICIAVTRV
jgi:V/A-type H+-transporting ATPase subunit I